jgi:hypothetical protein
VRRPDACSWDIDRPDGVVRSLQISEYKVEPSEAVLARNLLSNDDSRSAGGDKPEPLWPEVKISGESFALPGAGEILARTASTPHIDCVGPSCVSQGSAPDSNPAEEMALPVASNVCGFDVSDRSLINNSRGQLSSLDQVAGPLGGI